MSCVVMLWISFSKSNPIWLTPKKLSSLMLGGWDRKVKS
jgi:hypothetical protein